MTAKAGVICAVYSCNNYSISKNARSFFRFPRDPELCKSWVIRSERKDLLDMFLKYGSVYLNTNQRICSDHFKIEDFRNPNLFSQGLKRGAVPTENLSESVATLLDLEESGIMKEVETDDAAVYCVMTLSTDDSECYFSSVLREPCQEEDEIVEELPEERVYTPKLRKTFNMSRKGIMKQKNLVRKLQRDNARLYSVKKYSKANRKIDSGVA